MRRLVYQIGLISVILCVCSSHVTAQAQSSQTASPTKAVDMTVFGFSFGQPFTLPECERTSYGYKIDIRNVCFERLSDSKSKNRKNQALEPMVNETVKVRFPVLDGPQIVKGDGFLALILNGKLEGIGFNTLGVRNADSVLQTLKQKFGAPATVVSKKVRNVMGASFDAFHATWALSDLYITFDSAVYWI